MYAGVDIGGTKTLLAALDEHGVIIEQIRFATPQSYDDFLRELARSVVKLTNQDFKAGAVGLPATELDRHHGIGRSFGNLAWRNVPIQTDLEKLFACPIIPENDAKLAGLSEAMLLKDQYSRVLYITVSTGIGYGLTVDGTIDPNIGDGGGTLLLLEHHGKLTPWENFASGKAIVKRFGKKAAEIEDAATWKRIAHDLGLGITELVAVTEPEVIVFGGSVGAYFDRFKDALAHELVRYQTPLLPHPALRAAGRPNEAVVYGCYDLAKARYGPNH